MQAYDLSYCKGKQYFDEGSGKENYLVFLPMGKYFKLNSVVGVIDGVFIGVFRCRNKNWEDATGAHLSDF